MSSSAEERAGNFMESLKQCQWTLEEVCRLRDLIRSAENDALERAAQAIEPTSRDPIEECEQSRWSKVVLELAAMTIRALKHKVR